MWCVDISVSFVLIKISETWYTCNSYDMPPKIDKIPPPVLIVEDDRSCRESNKLFSVYLCNVDNSRHATSSLKVKSKRETSPRRVKISVRVELKSCEISPYKITRLRPPQKKMLVDKNEKCATQRAAWKWNQKKKETSPRRVKRSVKVELKPCEISP